MDTARAYYDGTVFVPLTPIKARKNQPVIITFPDDNDTQLGGKSYLRHAGALSNDNYVELVEILKDTQKVDADEW
jgi:hypothetical protein